jgi:glyoxylase-like metal-dependent hydrolase (beta-lactamase superfamily II)
MDDNVYRFEVGDFQCAAVADGGLVYEPPMFPAPPQFLFVNAAEDELAQALGAYGLIPKEWTSWTSPYTCLLVDTGTNRVLIDTGAGSLAPTTGTLIENLASLEIGPEQIDLVIITHAHPDHIGGNTAADGSPLFPRASWTMSKSEWDFWMEGQADKILPEHSKEILLGIAQRNLEPLKDRVDLVVGPTEVLPGIEILPARGHTPGHSAVAVSSAGQELLCLSDLVLHPLHLQQPEWFAGVDVMPDQLVDSRRELLNRAERQDSLVMLFHFPFPGLGRVRSRGKGWQWEPHRPTSS